MARAHDGRFLTQDEIERRASGRRHYNAVRQVRASVRRMQVAQLLTAGITARVEIAAQLGVHATTISRDIAALLRSQPGACPTCGRADELECYASFPRREEPPL